jgi:hypothetical protein
VAGGPAGPTGRSATEHRRKRARTHGELANARGIEKGVGPADLVALLLEQAIGREAGGNRRAILHGESPKRCARGERGGIIGGGGAGSEIAMGIVGGGGKCTISPATPTLSRLCAS